MSEKSYNYGVFDDLRYILVEIGKREREKG
jgi:hypothetical protein